MTRNLLWCTNGTSHFLQVRLQSCVEASSTSLSHHGPLPHFHIHCSCHFLPLPLCSQDSAHECQKIQIFAINTLAGTRWSWGNWEMKFKYFVGMSCKCQQFNQISAITNICTSKLRIDQWLEIFKSFVGMWESITQLSVKIQSSKQRYLHNWSW